MHGGEPTGPTRAAAPTGSKPAAIALVASAAVTGWAWRDFLTGAHSPFTSDIRHYHHAMIRAWSDAVGDGRLPLWTDHSYLGFPLFADPQLATWYPGTPLVAALGPDTGYVIFLVLHALLAAVGMLGLLRAHGSSWLAAFAGGMLVSLSGYYAHEAQHPGLFAILCWMPCWLWATRAFMLRPNPGAAAAIALVVAAMLFAGTLQVLFGGLLLYAFYLAATAWERGAQGNARAQTLHAALLAGLANALGLALAAVVILPAAAHLGHTARALGMTYAFASMGSAHPQDLLGLFVNSISTWGGVAGDLDYRGVSFFVGSLALPLAVLGAVAMPRRLALGLASALVLLTWLAMGRHGGLHAWLYEWMPGAVGGLRGMGRALGPASIVVAVLAACGVDALASADARGRLRFAAGLAFWLVVCGVVLQWGEGPIPFATWGSLGVAAVGLVAVVALARTRGTALPATLVALVVFDPLAFGALTDVLRANPSAPTDPRSPDGIAELEAVRDEGNPRIMLHGFGPLNLPLINGVDGVGGYNPLVMLQYLDFVTLVDHGRLFPRAPLDRFVSGAKPQRFDAPLFDAASIRQVFSNRHERTTGLVRRETFTSGPLAEHRAARYENTDSLPRAYLAYRTARSAGASDLETRLGRGFDARRVTVVGGEGPVLSGAPEIRAVERRGPRPELRTFDFETQAPAVLVVTDSWYPGWEARVDGEPAPVFRVNGIFRGVAVPAGATHVEMRFAPVTFRVGAAISLAAALAISLLLVLAFRRRSPR